MDLPTSTAVPSLVQAILRHLLSMEASGMMSSRELQEDLDRVQREELTRRGLELIQRDLGLALGV